MKKFIIPALAVSVLSLASALVIFQNKNYQEVSAYTVSSLATTIDLNDCSDDEIRSYYAGLKEPEYGDTIEFTIGNLILLTEHGDFGTEEKPWLRERNTILLPVAMRYL